MSEKKSQDEIWNDEVNEIIRSRFNDINLMYPKIRQSHRKEYGLPELDPIRVELTQCLIFGFYQAAITLTNHLLESMLKYTLIIVEGQKIQQTRQEIRGRAITGFSEKYKEAIQKINNKKLGNTINMAKRSGLINKTESKKLHEFREIFRNAYSHADKKKTFGESTIPMQAVRFEEGRIVEDESKVQTIADFIVGQGIFQAIIAKRTAPEYFLYIDQLTRKILKKLFPKLSS